MTTFDQLRELLKSNRSFRRFDNSLPVGEDTLHRLVGLTRYCSSGRNLQPLRYRLVSSPEECAAVFPALKWAGYLTDWDGPSESERPTAYLIQCIDTELTVENLAEQYGIECTPDLLTRAEAYALRRSGRSGRAAKHFIELEAAKQSAELQV